jgi:hypothetical protein
MSGRWGWGSCWRWRSCRRWGGPGIALPLALLATLVPVPAMAALRVLIVEGLGGEPAYTREFDAQAEAIAAASRTLTSPADVHLLVGAAATRQSVLQYLHSLARATGPEDQFALYLIGHGSYDGREYKFNLPGPDLADHDIASMLNALPMREQLVVAPGSCSGALLTALARAHRVLITGTRNGGEKTATRFGAAFVEALTSTEADTDKNRTISVHEAYEYANRRVQDYFRRETLLATEHAVLQGDDAGVFTVAALRAMQAGAAAAGGGAATGGASGAGAGAGAGAPGGAHVPAALLQQRAALNRRIAALEQRKGSMPPDQYTKQFEQLLIELAELQQRIDHAGAAPGDAP